ncbi:hypothetical protein [Chryseobacterium sp.]|uniref:hypothetical protein n=1 Tax=Chryseobacterium sp. TaxID=1871047 RepID=UPI002FC72F61
MGIAKKCLKFVQKDDKTTIIRDNVDILDDINSEELGDYINELQQDAKKQGKSWDDYLDDLANKSRPRKNALVKWLSKFDVNFINHLSGDVALEDLMIFFKKDYYIVPKGQGGHWLNKFLKVDAILEPPGIGNIENLPKDIPFKAKVTIRSLKGKMFPKSAESSMFPRNWSEIRIKEEVALAYEKSFVKGIGLNPNSVNKKFKQYKFKDSLGNFDILIEVDDIGNIMNAYPLL